MTVSIPVFAIQLDCEKNADGTYTCIEIGKPAVTPPAAEAVSSPKAASDDKTPPVEPDYLEQARKECVYNKPRKRIGGQKHGAAQKREQEKAARKDYEDCVAEAALRIRRAEKH